MKAEIKISIKQLVEFCPLFPSAFPVKRPRRFMDVTVVENGEEKRTDWNDRWGTLSSTELLQGKSCVTEMGGKPAGGGLGRVCVFPMPFIVESMWKIACRIQK